MAEKFYQAPKLEKIEDGAEEVVTKFDDIGFKIKDYPDLYKRLVELANMPKSHFEDAVKMSEMVDLLWADFKKDKQMKLSKNELKLACLFHDIGKSGPLGASREERFMIEQIFNSVYFNFNSEKYEKAFKNDPEFKGKSKDEIKALSRQLPISKILDIEDFPNKNEIKKYLKTLTIHIYHVEKNGIRKEAVPLDINKFSIHELWRAHDQWTLDLLENNNISKEIMIVASSHHALEGHDPANVRGKDYVAAIALETIDKYLIVALEIVDKYQAFIEREKLTHEAAIKRLLKIAKISRDKKIINHGDKTYNLFIKYINILKNNDKIAKIAIRK